jgi:hypothetical protein
MVILMDVFAIWVLKNTKLEVTIGGQLANMPLLFRTIPMREWE